MKKYSYFAYASLKKLIKAIWRSLLHSLLRPGVVLVILLLLLIFSAKIRQFNWINYSAMQFNSNFTRFIAVFYDGYAALTQGEDKIGHETSNDKLLAVQIENLQLHNQLLLAENKKAVKN